MFQRSTVPSFSLGLPGPEDGGIIIIQNILMTKGSLHLMKGLHTPALMGREQKVETDHTLKHYKTITYII
jgi:hypothetical protein